MRGDAGSRIIAATAKALGAALITCNGIIIMASGLVSVIW
jgi:hypothetical protein